MQDVKDLLAMIARGSQSRHDGKFELRLAIEYVDDLMQCVSAASETPDKSTPETD